MDKSVTLREVADAIRKNGVTQIKGHFFLTDTERSTNFLKSGETVIGACAIGQAALNLGVSSDLLGDALTRYGAGALIIEMNDELGKTFEEIADAIEGEWSMSLDTIILNSWDLGGENDG